MGQTDSRITRLNRSAELLSPACPCLTWGPPSIPALGELCVTAEALCTVTSVVFCPSHTAGLFQMENKNQGWVILDTLSPGQFLVHSRYSINARGFHQCALLSMIQNLTKHHDFLGTENWFSYTKLAQKNGQGFLKAEVGVARTAAPAKNTNTHSDRASVAVVRPCRGNIPVSPAT